jgi:Glycosyl transferase family 11
MLVRLTGGLGNQLFMYAFGRSLATIKNESLKFDWRRSTWDYALEPFRLPIILIEPTTVPLVYTENGFKWDSDAYKKPEGTYYNGYWQSEKYFNVDLLRKDFSWWVNSPLRVQFKNKAFIHVRRGDYLNRGTKEFHGLLPLEYYQAAIDYIKERVPDITFEVFTDDPDMREFLGYTVVSTGNQHLDLHTMTKYSHAILANSTFGWWASWLGEHSSQIVVAPKRWFNDPKIDTSDLIPERWVRL